MKTIFFFLTSFIASAAFANNQLEALQGFSRDKTGLHFQVDSGGCTNKSNFSIQVTQTTEGIEVSLLRLTADHCMAYIPYGIQISYSYEELDLPVGQSVHIVNSLE